MEKGLNMTIFWIVHLMMLGLFGLEMLFFLTVWLRSRVPGLPANASRWRKLVAAILYVLRIIFSRRIWILLRSLVVDGMLHRRLYQKNFRRWITHIMVFGSFLVMGVISTITGVVVEFLPLFGVSPEQIASIPFFGMLFHADVWWVALVNELLGLVLLVGMFLVLYRRYIQKDSQLRTNPIDNVIILLLTLIAFSGIFTETFRLLADYTTSAGVFAPSYTMLSPEKYPLALYPIWGPQWGFIGYALAWLLGLLKVGAGVWQVLLNVFFWLHFVIVTALLYYLPFSRFAHVILGPVIVAYNTMRDEESARQHKGQHVPQPAA
jgi:heterodisulfide reductase subunit E